MPPGAVNCTRVFIRSNDSRVNLVQYAFIRQGLGRAGRPTREAFGYSDWSMKAGQYSTAWLRRSSVSLWRGDTGVIGNTLLNRPSQGSDAILATQQARSNFVATAMWSSSAHDADGALQARRESALTPVFIRKLPM